MRALIRVAADAMMLTRGESRADFIALMLTQAFDWGEHLTEALPEALTARVEEHGELIRADFAFEVAPAGDEDETDEAPYRLLGR